MDIQFSGKQGEQSCPGLGRTYSQRCLDGISVSLHRGIFDQCYANGSLGRSGSGAPGTGALRGESRGVGTGVIARTTIEWLLFRNWKFDKISLYDLDPGEAEHLRKWLLDDYGLSSEIKEKVDDAISDSSLVLFTTTSSEPYLNDEKLFARTHGPASIAAGPGDKFDPCIAEHRRRHRSLPKSKYFTTPDRDSVR